MKKWILQTAIVVIIAVGCLVLLGWQLELALLKAGLPGSTVTMKPNTAVGLVLSGVALDFLHRRGTVRSTALKQWLSVTMSGCATLTFLLGALTLSQYLFGWNLGIDQVLFKGVASVTTLYPGRMGFNTASCFVLIGGALLLHRHRRTIGLAQLLSCIVAAIATVTLVEYCFSTSLETFMAVPTMMAPHTAATFLVLSFSILASAPNAGLMHTLTSPLAGGIVARMLLPWAIAFPLLVIGLLYKSEQAGVYDPAFSNTIEVIVMTFTFSALIWSSARLLNRSEAALRRSKEDLEQRVENRTAELIAMNYRLQHELVERQQAEQALRQQAKRERLITIVTQQIHQSLKLEEILSSVVSAVHQCLQSDRVGLYQFQPDGSGVFMAESVSEPLPAVLGTTAYAALSTQHLALHRQGVPVIVHDIQQYDFPPDVAAFLQCNQIRSFLTAPILCDNQLWGLLMVHYCHETHHWQPSEIDLLDQLATQLAIAIQQSELYQQVQQMNASLESQVQERTAQLQQALAFESLLKRITDKVRDSLDENQILQSVVQELAITLGADCCDTAIYSIDRTITTIQYQYHQGAAHSGRAACTIADSSDPNLYVQLFQGQYCHFCLIPQNVLRPNQPSMTTLACPIMDDQGVLGDLWLFKAVNETFNELEARLVQQVANQCAIALRQSRLYQAAQAQVTELERLNHLQDDFLSTVSHELRTPMSSIKMAAQMLEINLGKMDLLATKPNEIDRYLQILKDEGDREIDLINDLLDLSRLDSGTEPLMLTTMTLQTWIPYVAEPFVARTQSQQQVLQFDLPTELPPLTTDFGYLERILTELLHNAFKYTPAGECITLAAVATATHCCLSVANSGVEISTLEQSRIFTKFYRIPNHDPWQHAGTGIGLALVQKRIEQLQGAVTVVSAQGWTRFQVSIPWRLEDVPL